MANTSELIEALSDGSFDSSSAQSVSGSSYNFLEALPQGFFFNLIIAVVLLVMGFVLGKVVKLILRKMLARAGIRRETKNNFYFLFLIIIEWSIYILFINFALIQLDIPALTQWITSILFVIPALTGALLLISIGFIIGTYLKGLIEDSKIEGGEWLSQIFFFFVLYVFMIFAFKTALISMDKDTVNFLLIALSIIVGIGVTVAHFIKRK
ncbi:MAG: hypothetical protein ABIE22_01290 [archaeon]